MTRFYPIYLSLISIMLICKAAVAQTGSVAGRVEVEGEVAAYAIVTIDSLHIGTLSDAHGKYILQDIPLGRHSLTVQFIGYQDVVQSVSLTVKKPHIRSNVQLKEKKLDLDGIVVTGSKTIEYKKNSAILVSTLSKKTLENVQACNLSEGLKFQPGLRVENNCQTCNYTQLRINGLAGGYSQILINGRPIFSPLTGLYGLEQLPTNMIERIEVVKGGGSSLYGSSAIGGTVNVITKLPANNGYNLTGTYNTIKGESTDFQLAGDATIVAENDKSGLSMFLNKRERDFYDHNGDNFSELPALNITSLGLNAFFLPKENQKVELSLSHLYEYRFGGEIISGPAYQAAQAEERTHNVWMGTADYQVNSADGSSSLISYIAWQHTDREHYTGILPDEPTALADHYENAPYGTSDVTTYNIGLQLNRRVSNFWKGENIFTIGTEYIYDDVNDEIAAYNYLIDQTTQNFGVFGQSNWKLTPKVTLLSGLRMDVHNLIDRPVLNPRVSLLLKPIANTQVRINYGQGFRAPQAFDTDLHIAFAGGGISRVQLSPDLAPETSQSLSTSISADFPSEHLVAGFTLEGFHTSLEEAFFLQPIGEDAFGEVFQKQNGQGATVQGVTLELRANFDRKLQLESGFTVQSSLFDRAVQYIEEIPGIRAFIRTPNEYGFATLSYTPTKKIEANLNYVYTGSMRVPHFGGAENQQVNEIIDSESFHDLSGKVAYTFTPKEINIGLELFMGVGNVLNAYQSTFDVGKNRDSNFVYGPAQPRTLFVGLKVIGL